MNSRQQDFRRVTSAFSLGASGFIIGQSDNRSGFSCQKEQITLSALVEASLFASDAILRPILYEQAQFQIIVSLLLA